MSIHYLFLYLKKNLTTPKIKDLVNKPNEQYKKIYQTINNQDVIQNNNEDPIPINNQNAIMVNNDEEKEQRKNELKEYMKSLAESKNGTEEFAKTNQPNQSDNIQNTESIIESYNSNSNFSTF